MTEQTTVNAVKSVEANTPSTEPAQEPEKKYTDADVDAIIDKKFAKWKSDQDKAIADAVAKVEEANRLAQMNDKEKADHERKAMESELAALKAEKAHNSMMTEARVMLKADGLNIPDEIIGVLVSDSAEQTSEAVKAFSGLFQKAVDDAVKERLAGSEPRRGGGGAALSKEEIMQEKDPTKRLKLIEENMALFEDNFTGGKK